MTSKPPIVIDNGTGYTKMGYAGNTVPDYMVPTIIGMPEKKQVQSKMILQTWSFILVTMLWTNV